MGFPSSCALGPPCSPLPKTPSYLPCGAVVFWAFLLFIFFFFFNWRVDTAGEEEGKMNCESSIERYTLPYALYPLKPSVSCHIKKGLQSTNACHAQCVALGGAFVFLGEAKP